MNKKELQKLQKKVQKLQKKSTEYFELLNKELEELNNGLKCDNDTEVSGGNEKRTRRATPRRDTSKKTSEKFNTIDTEED